MGEGWALLTIVGAHWIAQIEDKMARQRTNSLNIGRMKLPGWGDERGDSGWSGGFLCRYLGCRGNECGQEVRWVQFYILMRGIVAAFAGPPIPQAVCRGSIATGSSQGRHGCVRSACRGRDPSPPRRPTDLAATKPRWAVTRSPKLPTNPISSEGGTGQDPPKQVKV